MDLPQYIPMEGKAKDSCEIQNDADGESKILLRLRFLVKGGNINDDDEDDDDEDLNY